MPKIAYVCETCWEGAAEMSCWEDPAMLGTLPDGTQLCQDCYEDGDYLRDDDGERPRWSDLPTPPTYIAKG